MKKFILMAASVSALCAGPIIAPLVDYDKEDMIGLDRPDLGLHRRSLYNGKQIALDTLFARILPGGAVGGDGDLVDLIDEDNSPLLHFANRQVFEFFFIEEGFARFSGED